MTRPPVSAPARLDRLRSGQRAADADQQPHLFVDFDALDRVLDSRTRCNWLCEPNLHVFAKLFEDRLERGLEAQALSGREIGGDDDVLNFFVGHLVDVTRRYQIGRVLHFVSELRTP